MENLYHHKNAPMCGCIYLHACALFQIYSCARVHQFSIFAVISMFVRCMQVRIRRHMTVSSLYRMEKRCDPPGKIQTFQCEPEQHFFSELDTYPSVSAKTISFLNKQRV